MGLDPNAVLAVSSVEGLSGRVGDGGHAFGPFQLNDAGGVLTNRPGDHRAFAESKAGINWALQQIAAVAKGKTGQSAVQAIVSQFERPADIPGEIGRATQAYGHVGSSGPLPPSGGGGQLGAAGPALAQQNDAYRAQLASVLQAQTQRFLHGDLSPHPEDNVVLAQLAQMRQQSTAAQDRFGNTGSSRLTGVGSGAPMKSGAGVQWLGVPTAGENGGLLAKVSKAASAVGITKIRVTSGARSKEHNIAVGGAPNSNHLTGHALDGEGYVPGKGWVPLGQALLPVAGKFGLRSGATFTWGGKPDVVHVDDAFNQ